MRARPVRIDQRRGSSSLAALPPPRPAPARQRPDGVTGGGRGRGDDRYRSPSRPMRSQHSISAARTGRAQALEWTTRRSPSTSSGLGGRTEASILPPSASTSARFGRPAGQRRQCRLVGRQAGGEGVGAGFGGAVGKRLRVGDREQLPDDHGRQTAIGVAAAARPGPVPPSRRPGPAQARVPPPAGPGEALVLARGSSPAVAPTSIAGSRSSDRGACASRPHPLTGPFDLGPVGERPRQRRLGRILGVAADQFRPGRRAGRAGSRPRVPADRSDLREHRAKGDQSRERRDEGTLACPSLSDPIEAMRRRSARPSYGWRSHPRRSVTDQ